MLYTLTLNPYTFLTMKNNITDIFGIQHPIIQAGMIWTSGWRLASAASNAGCLGLIGSASMYPDVLREHIQKEDECLFPMSDRAMNEEDQRGLMKSFEAVHAEEIDPEVQRKCLDIAANLAEEFKVPEAAVDLKW